MNTLLIRRRALAPLLAAALLAACASAPTPPATPLPPIVFVHGNGDTAALWTPTVWRWESNGWPRERLHAVHFPYPLARDDNTVPQDGRSSTEDQRRYLAAEVDKVLAATGAAQVVLIGNSRGGNAIRDYIANGASPVGGGAAKVSHAILGGTPNHGVQAIPDVNPNNEFNGAGPFLVGLNAPKGPNGNEVTPGVRWMTIIEGINDIGGGIGAEFNFPLRPDAPASEVVTPAELIGAYRQIIERAHEHGIKVFGSPLMPFEGAAYYSEHGAATRDAVNQWIRTSGAFDAVIDFDAVVRDPAHPTHMKAEFDSGDHLHPNDAGYKAMAEAIDLSLFIPAKNESTGRQSRRRSKAAH